MCLQVSKVVVLTCRLPGCTSGPGEEMPQSERPGSWGLRSSHSTGGGEESRGDDKRSREGMGGENRRESYPAIERDAQVLKPKHTNSQCFVGENPRVGQYICH